VTRAALVFESISAVVASRLVVEESWLVVDVSVASSSAIRRRASSSPCGVVVSTGTS
jgi:hypothetical protein